MIKIFATVITLAASCAVAAPTTNAPGNRFEFPARPTATGAPVIYEHSREAGPDETFFLVGENLTTNLTAWGVSAASPCGQLWKPRVQFLTSGYLAATMPEKSQDGPFVVWAQNAAGFSAPFVLNAPQPWWCVAENNLVRVFGRNLARRPDFTRAFVCLCRPGQPGVWADVVKAGKYEVSFRLPEKIQLGDYEVWLHAGDGGELGWGGPVKLRITELPVTKKSYLSSTFTCKATPFRGGSGAEIQQALDSLAEHGGGALELPAGQFPFTSTLRVPANVTLCGAGQHATTLQLVHDSTGVITNRAAVWLCGDGAGVRDLTLLGDARVNIGIAIRSPQDLAWLANCLVERVRVADIDGKQAENCGVHLHHASGAVVRNNELWGRVPIFIAGAKQCRLAYNRLVSVTRFGGNAEAAILGRCDTIEECVIEHNTIACPPGAESGGPTARRLLWFSTGHGSVTHNWIADNGADRARFGGIAGTDQNVGEMILFEGNHRTAYFGPLADADAQSVTLPKTIPPTPEKFLGNVKREQLAHDADGNETPFWPPDLDDGIAEPPLREYYVTIFSGRGQGQTRRVVRRTAEKLFLDSPWRVAPVAGSVVAVAVGFHQNHIVRNQTCDGMTGVQLWISCVENIIAANTIARQRKPGLYLYANGTTLASSMPRTWNRGISPLFWNVAEGNRVEETSAGALVTSGETPGLPVEFPRALGNILRHNSFIRSRTDGVIVNASATGTIVEFNVVRDAQTGYHAAPCSDATVFRRNHAYFWYPVNNSTNAPVAIQIDNPDTTVAVEKNSVEGIHGASDKRVLDLKRGAEILRLPER